jgi:alkaline phosphatase
MNRRDFFRNGAITVVGSTLINPFSAVAAINPPTAKLGIQGGTAKNIIFMVSDGMSTGTLNMADLHLKRKFGRQSNWLSLYQENRSIRALMDTASANSLVTDSAAASSSWGGGVRVNNGSLNVGAGGEAYKPILQKFKDAGKAVGCVTTVPITHATPAGFCVNVGSRGDQSKIAELYLPLKFDVMMGGGAQYFDSHKRKDGIDMYQKYTSAGYTLVRNRSEMMALNTNKPVLGTFAKDGLPYTLDRNQDKILQDTVPTLAEMTKTAISLMSKNNRGFVLQVEGGKVDWAAHANDVGALIYDQIGFDEALGEALDFAEKDGNTLVIVTTDHGNSNPGLFSGENANFDRIGNFKHSNEWLLQHIQKDRTASQVIEKIEATQNMVISKEEANELLQHFHKQDKTGLYNTENVPFKILADIQQKYTNVGWGSMDHSSDYVELAMVGPGSNLLKPFVKNTDLHNLMLRATEVLD